MRENSRDGYHVPFVHPFLRKASPPGPYTLFENAHALQVLDMEERAFAPAVWTQMMDDRLPGVEPGEGYIINVFPDTVFQLRSNEFSIASQRVLGMNAIVLESRVLGLKGDEQAVREGRISADATWFGDALEFEDKPVFEAQQRGIVGTGLRYSIIARGPDARTGLRGDDNRLRDWWARWREMMGVSMNSLVEEFE